ncbi:MAG: cbb3-type cytochrome c oxidase N-terminal domain-containing protein [Planctomycetota bacterium]
MITNDPNTSSPMPKVLRYDDFVAEQRKQAEAAKPAAIESAAADLAEAQRRYQEQLRAFSPSYYEQVFSPKTAAVAGFASAAAAAEPEPVDELTDHNYDGIQEYDNPTPGWWYLIFGATAAFSVLYVFVFHMSTLVPTLPERHAAAEARIFEQRFAELNQLPMGEEKVLTIMTRTEWLDKGANIFAGSCAICHNADGSGLVGPNLTDDLYKNIASLMDIADLVSEGTESGSMPAQKNLLNPNEIALVTAYVASLRGQDLPTGETVLPEYLGTPIDPWPSPDPSATPQATATNVNLSD